MYSWYTWLIRTRLVPQLRHTRVSDEVPAEGRGVTRTLNARERDAPAAEEGDKLCLEAGRVVRDVLAGRLADAEHVAQVRLAHLVALEA